MCIEIKLIIDGNIYVKKVCVIFNGFLRENKIVNNFLFYFIILRCDGGM